MSQDNHPKGPREAMDPFGTQKELTVFKGRYNLPVTLLRLNEEVTRRFQAFE